VELTIEKLVYGGDGLARLGSADSGQRSKTVFIPYVLPGESVEARIVEQHPGFARAQLERVLKPSDLRSAPPCPYFGQCGGCHYQHASYEDQVRFKSEILRETMRRIAKLEIEIAMHTHPSPPLNYRNRTRFHVRVDPEFAIGYFRHASHELLPVRACPISSPLINGALNELWRMAEAKALPNTVSEIELFANDIDRRLMAELSLRPAGRVDGALKEFARCFTSSLPEVQGISGFWPSSSTTRSAAALIYGEPAMRYQVLDETYQVSAGSFFQINRFLISRMVELAIGDQTGSLALDLYSGVGLFAVPLARRFERVIAVESSPVSSADLRVNVPENVKVSTQMTGRYLHAAGKMKPDMILVDPPRSGLGSEVCKAIVNLRANQLVYVSCDPATLARDLKQLTAAGFTIAEMHLIDLFPQTFHIESITVLRKGR